MSKMVTNEQLRAALKRVQAAVGDQGPFGAVRVGGGLIQARNATTYAAAPLAIDKELMFDYKILAAVSGKMPVDAEIEIKSTPIGDKLVLRKGRLHAAVESYPLTYADSLPPIKSIPEHAWRACDAGLVAALKSLLKFQVGNEHSPPWMAAITKANGKLLAVMRRGRAVVWADDVWFQEHESLLIPALFCSHLVGNVTPIKIAVFGGSIAAEWFDGALFCTALLAGDPPLSIEGVLKRYETPTQEVSSVLKESIASVAKISTQKIRISSGTMSGASSDGRVYVSDVADIVGEVTVDSDVLCVVAGEASFMEFHSKLGGSSFSGPRVRGLFMTTQPE